MSKQKEILLLAIERGYIVDKAGNVFKDDKGVKGSVSNRNYKKFNIRNLNYESHPVFIHRLQAYQKYGDKIFEEGIVVRHLNGNSLDNSWDNIELGTSSENQMDRSEECRKNSSMKATRAYQNSIRTYEERFAIYKKIKNGVSYNNISKNRNIAKSTLSYIKNKSTEYKEYIK